jgi:hypothetical protein
MKTLEGIVTSVQESRFLVQTDQGDYQHFVLSQKAPLEPDQLQELQRRQSRVRIGYEPGDNVIAWVARSISLVEHRDPPNLAGPGA